MSSPRPSPFPRRDVEPPAPPTGPARRADRAAAATSKTAAATGTTRRPLGWGVALAAVCAFAGVLWIVQFVDAGLGHRLDRFGIVPRTVSGLWGVLTEPFLHTGYGRLASDTLPVVLIGWVVMLAGVRVWLLVTTSVSVLGALLTWAAGPGDTLIVGSSGLVFGWLGYLLARAVFSRRLRWIAVAVGVLFFFGTLLAGLAPTLHSEVPWQAHVCGFGAGVLVGAVLHPRGADLRRLRRTAVS